MANVRFWHKADMSGSGLLPCKLTPERHSPGSPIAVDFRMFGQNARQVFQRQSGAPHARLLCILPLSRRSAE
jgi:hypothetical protein